MKRTRKNAFTLIELLVVISIIALLIGILLPALGQAKKRANGLKDSANIRSLMQGLTIFAGNNRDTYPLPSRIDRNDKTLVPTGGVAATKDTTGNIFSILIDGGGIDVAICFSPLELGNYEEYRDYEFDAPSGGVEVGDISQALWDPNFKGTPNDEGANGGTMNSAPPAADLPGWEDLPGGFSYAHTPPFAFRRPTWANTFEALEPALANRGPVYQLNGGGEDGTWDLYDDGGDASGDGNTPLGVSSITLATSGSSTAWAGNIGFNDAHVENFSAPDPSQIVWSFADLNDEHRTQPDNVFMNEDDTTREVEEFPPAEFNEITGPSNNRNAYLVQYSEVNEDLDIRRYYD